MTPLMKMHTLGHDFVPDPIHAGGLRYHGMSPLISHLYETGEIEAVAKPQTECFSAGVLFARSRRNSRTAYAVDAQAVERLLEAGPG